MPSKFYVVWIGRRTGVFTDWASAQHAVDKFAGARFKAFPTRAEAEQAYREGKHSAAYPRRGAAKPSGVKDEPRSEPAIITESPFDVRIYCDGACEPNPGNAGSGIVVYRHGKLAELWYGLYNSEGTNNSAELSALHHGLRMAQTEIDADNSVQVLSDSQYSLNCIRTWAAGWEKKGWKRKQEGDIKNLEVIQAAYTTYKEIEDEVQLTHVAGHAGIEGNELADRMAMLAVQTHQEELRLYDGDMNVDLLLKMRPG
jgi:ribonuclease HI